MESRQWAAGLVTARQRQILELVAIGSPNKVIAKKLGLSERTVRTHLERLFRKLDVHTQTQAVVVDDAIELRRLKDENGRLKRLVAELSPDSERGEPGGMFWNYRDPERRSP